LPEATVLRSRLASLSADVSPPKSHR
jgi:hypothetical protein